MKRILLFIATNLAVVLLLSVIASVLGVDRFLTQNGLDLQSLLWFSLLMGFGGSFISLLISKQIALWSTGAHVIKEPEGAHEQWLVATVRRLADKANIGMPEVAVYDGAPNAFATGAFKNSALVAVSTGLLESMSREEVEAVLGHEITHVSNGDMVTLTLIQGVLNTFVFFLSRVVGFIVVFPLARRGLHRGQDGVPHRARHRAGLLHHGHGEPDRVRDTGFRDRHVVFAPARIPRRRGFGAAARHTPADDRRAHAPGRHATGRAAAVDRHGGRERRAGMGVAVLQPSADRGSHPGPAGPDVKAFALQGRT